MIGAPRRWGGGALALFAAVAFGFHNVIAGAALAGGSEPATLIAFRCLFAAAAIFLYCRVRGERLRLEPRLRRAALALGLVLALQSFSLLSAFQRLPVSLAILLFYTFPIWVALASIVVERQRLAARTGLALALGLAGLALALDVSVAAFEWSGVAFGALAAALMTFTVIGGGRTVRAAGPVPTSFHTILCSGCVFAAIVAFQGGPALPNSSDGWMALAAVPVTYLIAVMSFFLAMAKITGTRLSTIMNSEPVFTIALAAAILGERLSPVQAAGAALVVVAILIAGRPRPAAATAE